ncbi:MFS transporter [Actinoplanes sp. NPDC051346]|uniref:MFS transporter n=1 Tax=Actinoplanes sp. NPDC051346 TaxID=3155048 RepID=UPI003449FC26
MVDSEGVTQQRWRAGTAVATAAMTASMLVLYALSALAPLFTADLGLDRAAVGLLVTATFAVAAAVSLIAGRIVDQSGPRRSLLALGVIVTVALAGASFARDYASLLAALAVAGVAQALANPATNLQIGRTVPAGHRGTAIGVKQAGVQLAAFGAGLVLPVLGAAVGWQAALRWSMVLPVALVVAVWWVVPGQPAAGGGSWWRWPRPSPWLSRLMVYSLLLGTALATVNTYLPLYAAQSLGLGPGAAGAVLAAFGVSGLVARVGWARVADRLAEVTVALRWLSLAAAGFVVLVCLAAPLWSPLVWLGAIGIGGSATAANAVSMLAVVRRAGPTGHASALVSLGFFAGFVVGPAGFGLLADAAGYGWAWSVVAAVFVASALTALLVRDRATVS